jgi:hypothetical protein
VSENSIPIEFADCANLQQAEGSQDCGIFAAVFAVQIAHDAAAKQRNKQPTQQPSYKAIDIQQVGRAWIAANLLQLFEICC